MDDWALCAPGTFPRLGPHTGALHALTRAYNEKKLDQQASYIVTSSVAAIPASVYVESAANKSEDKFVQIEKMEINLRKKQFVSLNPQLKKNAASDFISVSGLLFAAYRAGKISIKNHIAGRALLLSLIPAAYKISEKAVRHIFATPSFLVYDNLHKLLLGNLDFDAIFKSPVRIEIPAVNINKAGWTLDQILSDPPLYLNGWKNEGWVSVTNFKPEDTDRSNRDRNENYIRKMINGMRIEGNFNPGRHDNDDAIFDTATMSNMPIHFAISQGYSNIVVLHYNSRAEGPTDRVFRTWTEDTNRCGDLRVSENTRKTMLGYLRVNNDLAQLHRQRESLKRLEELLSYRYIDSHSQQIIRRHFQDMNDTFTKLSYFHKKEVAILFVGSEPIPDVHFSDFTSELIRLGINRGWDAGWDALPQINKMLRK